MTVPGVLDDQALRRYRELLDAEDAAFDELEHAYEEGDRAHYEADLSAWRQSLVRKLTFLQRMGIDIPQPAVFLDPQTFDPADFYLEQAARRRHARTRAPRSSGGCGRGRSRCARVLPPR